MTDLFQLHINAVDNERCYSIQTPNKKEALEFLKKYDHEGSSLQLDSDRDQITIDNNDEIYKYLSGE